MIGTTTGMMMTPTCASRGWTQIGTAGSPGANGAATTVRSTTTTGTAMACCPATSCVRDRTEDRTERTAPGTTPGTSASNVWTAITTATSRPPNGPGTSACSTAST